MKHDDKIESPDTSVQKGQNGNIKADGVVFPAFDYSRYMLRHLGVYILIFFGLFLINLIHRHLSGGDTFSLVVKVYLFVFAFFLIYNVTIAAPEEIKKLYSGRAARILYIFESKLIPILTLYLMVAFYTLSDYANEPGWPLFSFIRALDGQHTNLIVYSLLLMYALKARVNPLFTIPVFFAIAFAYYRINLLFYSDNYAGLPVLLYKGAKLCAIFFLSIWDLTLHLMSALKRFLFSLAASAAALAGVFGLLMSLYLLSAPGTPVWMEAGKKLSRFGYRAPLKRIARLAGERKNVRMLKDIYRLLDYYDMRLEYSPERWEGLLYQLRIENAELAASFMLKEGVTVNACDLADYVKMKANSSSPMQLNSLATLCAKSTADDATVMYLLARLAENNTKSYTLWLVKVLSETGSCLPVIPLSEMLFSIDEDISRAVYESLKSLSGLSPAERDGVLYNSTGVLREFRDFYRQNCISE